MKQTILLPFLLIAVSGLLQGASSDSENFNITLWEPGKVPLAKGEAPLDAPFLTAFLPPENKRNGSAAIIAPGGGNIMLMYDVEGMHVAERMAEWGTAAFVLTYRLEPRYGEDARVLDGNRAVRLIRSRAAEFKIDPKRILFGGFSAGGSLTRDVTVASGPGSPNAADPDPVDRYHSRPDFLLMVYGPGTAKPQDKLSEFPPTFLLSAAHDPGAANGTVQLFQDLNKAGAIVEMHIYQKGRHGFGASTSSPEFGPWMDALKHFLSLNGYFGGAK